MNVAIEVPMLTVSGGRTVWTAMKHGCIPRPTPIPAIIMKPKMRQSGESTVMSVIRPLATA